MRFNGLYLAALAGATVLFGACGDSTDDEVPTPTVAAATGTATSLPLATQTPPPSATGTASPLTPTSTGASGRLEIASTVQIVDVRTGEVTTLYEDTESAAFEAAFSGGHVLVAASSGTLQFELDGTTVSGDPPLLDCVQTDGAAEVEGRGYDGVFCGSLSPDRGWMTYPVDAGEVTLPSGHTVPKWDQWLVNLEAGETRLIQAGLVHCGGCDGRYGPRWSASSQYVVYAEFGGDRRRFLTAVNAGTTRAIGAGNEVTEAPAWSPAGDVLVYGSLTGGPSVLEDLSAGTSRVLDLAWPIAFDQSGTLLYSPAWSPSPKATGLSTTIVEAASGSVVDILPGAPPSSFVWTGSEAVAVSPEGLVAVLQQGAGCEGTAIYVDGKLRQCIVDGVEGAIGPGGLVAVARKTVAVGPAFGPGFETLSIDQFDIDLVGPGGDVRTVVTGAAGFAAPLMAWNGGGTHLLVLWPHSVGI